MQRVTIQEAEEFIRQVAQELPDRVMEAEERTLVDLEESARKYSSGGLSSRQLAALGNPYASRRGSPLLNPNIVNVQSRGLVEGWDTNGPVLTGGSVESSLYNDAPEAALLEKGTRFMFARAPHEAAYAEVEPRREQRLEAVLSGLLEGK